MLQVPWVEGQVNVFQSVAGGVSRDTFGTALEFVCKSKVNNGFKSLRLEKMKSTVWCIATKADERPSFAVDFGQLSVLNDASIPRPFICLCP